MHSRWKWQQSPSDELRRNSSVNEVLDLLVRNDIRTLWTNTPRPRIRTQELHAFRQIELEAVLDCAELPERAPLRSRQHCIGWSLEAARYGS